jgi:phosphotransferase system enzyme I (PtsI)
MARQYQGVGGAPGIVIGRVFRYAFSAAAEQSAEAEEEDAAAALERFATAQQTAADYLRTLEQQLRSEGRATEAAILDTQALFVEDIAISDEVTRRVQDEHEPLEQALAATISQLHVSFENIDDSYLRERAADIDAAGHALFAALRGTITHFDNLTPDAIIVADDLTPAETATLRAGAVAGFATAHGGPTSHTAILARSLGIPAAVGLGDAVLELAHGTEVILDGSQALLIAGPDAAERAQWQQRIAEQQAAQQRQQALRIQPGQTADGQPVALWANIGSPGQSHLDEIRVALDYGAEGVGLFRTEFLFLNRDAPPDEEEQYQVYRSTLEAMGGRTVVIRTLDIGGDKPLPYLKLPSEANPFLGIRGLRLCMRHPDLFQAQLRALLRAAVHGDLWIMLPMIATPADLAWGREQLRAAAHSLTAEGIEHRPDPPLGIMIETPAAAVTVDLLARDAAFLSVGSNDLTQYTLAADRGSAELAADYAHDATGVLRLIHQAASAAAQAGISIGVCGDLGGVPAVAPLLVGMGISKLSMAPALLPAVKERLLAFTLEEARQAAQAALKG